MKKKNNQPEKDMLQLEYHKIVRTIQYHRTQLEAAFLKTLITRRNEILKILRAKYEMK